LAFHVGDEIVVESAGAYTTTYSSIGFNGIPPLRGYYVEALLRGYVRERKGPLF
jgi:hypothetical protein